MQAVFLDRATFGIALEPPACAFTSYDETAPDQVVNRLVDADIAIINKVVLTQDIMAQLPKLKLIQLTATGTNNVDLMAADKLGITVKNVTNYSYISVPEHTLMLMLMALRAGADYHRKATDGTWQNATQFCVADVPLLDLHAKTVGIIGAGNIGRRVGELVHAFGAKVVYAEHQDATSVRQGRTAFATVLADADILSLHCPLSKHTHHLINDDTIAQCQRQPIIVNTARGAVVDSHAVCRGLTSGQLSGYATDVLDTEPPTADEPLFTLQHPRLIITPHNAWASEHAQHSLWHIAKTQVDQFVRSHSSKP